MIAPKETMEAMIEIRAMRSPRQKYCMMARLNGRVHTRTNQIVSGSNLYAIFANTVLEAPARPLITKGFQYLAPIPYCLKLRPFHFEMQKEKIPITKHLEKAKSKASISYSVSKFLPVPSKIVQPTYAIATNAKSLRKVIQDSCCFYKTCDSVIQNLIFLLTF